MKLEFLLLKFRNLIADKERLIACANRELQQLDGWQCDWQEGFQLVDQEIAEIVAMIEKEMK